MPSPFPGMDPFLEHPDLFSGLHDRLITYLSEVLTASLPKPYYADIHDRVWVEVSRRYIGPDVNVLYPERHRNGGPVSTPTGGSTAVATATEPVVVHVPHDEFRETFLQIYTRQGSERLVTHVEVLSPANKAPGEHGRDLYVRKQREILGSKAHLVEIDVLRAGTHSTAVPLDRALPRTGPFDYHVCIHHYDNLEDYFVYPIHLEQPLPTIAIPLLPGDGAVSIDLQAVFMRAYDAGPYARRVSYAQDSIVPALDTERTAWVTQRLRDQGLLP